MRWSKKMTTVYYVLAVHWITFRITELLEVSYISRQGIDKYYGIDWYFGSMQKYLKHWIIYRFHSDE